VSQGLGASLRCNKGREKTKDIKSAETNKNCSQRGEQSPLFVSEPVNSKESGRLEKSSKANKMLLDTDFMNFQ
jgi:hypothetical protein